MNDKDIPLAILHSVEQQDAVPKISESLDTSRECFLKGALRLPFNHPVTPTQWDLTHGFGGFILYLRNAAKSREPTLLHIDDTPFSQYFSHVASKPFRVPELSDRIKALTGTLPP